MQLLSLEHQVLKVDGAASCSTDRIVCIMLTYLSKYICSYRMMNNLLLPMIVPLSIYYIVWKEYILDPLKYSGPLNHRHLGGPFIESTATVETPIDSII